MDLSTLKRQLFKNRRTTTTFVVGTFVLLGFYYYAVVQSVPFSTFLRSNSPLFIFLQILLSFINALLGAAGVTLVGQLFRQQQQNGSMNVFQSAVALFLSVATTGCYVCGSILLPSLGIASSLAALPLGGLEVKLITAGLLLYSLRDLHRKLLGICEIPRPLVVKLELGEKNWQLKLNNWQQWRAGAITLSMVVLIFALPAITPKNMFSINDPNVYSCKHEG